MQFHKLPSGTIVDIDAISRITAPKDYDGSAGVLYWSSGLRGEAIGADADALYAAVDALVCNPTPVADSEPPAGDSTARLNDVLNQIKKLRSGLRRGEYWLPGDAADELTIILGEEPAPDHDYDSDKEVKL